MAVSASAVALPVVVVKLGGDVLNGARLIECATSLGEAVRANDRRFVVVHGGGSQVTDLATRLGIPTKQIAGRRVTDAATLDVVKMVIAGRLNIDLCLALRAAGVPAVGLHAGSGIIRAVRRPPKPLPSAGPDPVDLGLVGDVTGFDTGLLEALWAASTVPVLSCLGATAAGTLLNINADMTAAQLAAALGAEALVTVTGVGGVRKNQDDPASRIARLTIAQARDAIATGVVTGGMIAKLEEAFAPLQAGVGSVQIVAPGEIAASLRADGTVGTTLHVLVRPTKGENP